MLKRLLVLSFVFCMCVPAWAATYNVTGAVSWTEREGVDGTTPTTSADTIVLADGASLTISSGTVTVGVIEVQPMAKAELSIMSSTVQVGGRESTSIIVGRSGVLDISGTGKIAIEGIIDAQNSSTFQVGDRIALAFEGNSSSIKMEQASKLTLLASTVTLSSAVNVRTQAGTTILLGEAAVGQELLKFNATDSKMQLSGSGNAMYVNVKTDIIGSLSLELVGTAGASFDTGVFSGGTITFKGADETFFSLKGGSLIKQTAINIDAPVYLEAAKAIQPNAGSKLEIYEAGRLYVKAVGAIGKATGYPGSGTVDPDAPMSLVNNGLLSLAASQAFSVLSGFGEIAFSNKAVLFLKHAPSEPYSGALTGSGYIGYAGGNSIPWNFTNPLSEDIGVDVYGSTVLEFKDAAYVPIIRLRSETPSAKSLSGTVGRISVANELAVNSMFIDAASTNVLSGILYGPGVILIKDIHYCNNASNFTEQNGIAALAHTALNITNSADVIISGASKGAKSNSLITLTSASLWLYSDQSLGLENFSAFNNSKLRLFSGASVKGALTFDDSSKIVIELLERNLRAPVMTVSGRASVRKIGVIPMSQTINGTYQLVSGTITSFDLESPISGDITITSSDSVFYVDDAYWLPALGDMETAIVAGRNTIQIPVASVPSIYDNVNIVCSADAIIGDWSELKAEYDRSMNKIVVTGTLDPVFPLSLAMFRITMTVDSRGGNLIGAERYYMNDSVNPNTDPIIVDPDDPLDEIETNTSLTSESTFLFNGEDAYLLLGQWVDLNNAPITVLNPVVYTVRYVDGQWHTIRREDIKIGSDGRFIIHKLSSLDNDEVKVYVEGTRKDAGSPVRSREQYFIVGNGILTGDIFYSIKGLNEPDWRPGEMELGKMPKVGDIMTFRTSNWMNRKASVGDENIKVVDWNINGRSYPGVQNPGEANGKSLTLEYEIQEDDLVNPVSNRPRFDFRAKVHVTNVKTDMDGSATIDVKLTSSAPINPDTDSDPTPSNGEGEDSGGGCNANKTHSSYAILCYFALAIAFLKRKVKA